MEPEGSYEDLVDVKHGLLGDSHLGIVRCLLSKPILIHEWKHTIFYTLVKCGNTSMKMGHR